MSLALVVIILSSIPKISSVYQRHEHQYLPVSIQDTIEADAIVLLSGDVSIPAPPRVETQVRGNRSIHAMRLFHANKAPLIIVTGGNVFPQRDLKPEAEYTAMLLVEFGVPKDVIIVEAKSRNTRDNAVAVAQILDEIQLDHVLLVTDAFHMPRALATFRTAGINASPSVSSITAKLQKPDILEWLPSLTALATLDSVVHEKLGIFVYRLRGWIN